MTSKRPKLLHFLAIKKISTISIRASVHLTTMHHQDQTYPLTPIQHIHLIRAKEFILRIVAFDNKQNILISQDFSTDKFGGLLVTLPTGKKTSLVHSFSIYEISHYPDIQLLLGNFLPLELVSPIKLIISDLDRTLVETKSSSPKDIYRSLTNSLSIYPKIEKTIKIIREYQTRGFSPFIVSASPHFYEHIIRDWLYSNDIYTASIFLKDYRQFFSLSEGYLLPKDIKTQGLYKLAHLLDIILMTDIPYDLVLLGDDSEADPLIYVLLASILQDDREPHDIWRQIKSHPSFRLKGRQHSYFLDKTYQMKNMLKKSTIRPNITILIRQINIGTIRMKQIPKFIESKMKLIQSY